MKEEKTLSRYIYYNCKNIVCQDDNGNVINGMKLDSEDYNNGTVTVLRFRNGYLDGDVFNEDGTLKLTLPAVESQNHQEFWRQNKLHRDNGLPAIVSGDPAQKEYWVNGIRQKNPENSEKIKTLADTANTNDKEKD